MAPSPKTKHGLKQIVAALGQPRVAGMLALGFASGLPFLLTGATFGAWLDDAGTSLTAIGLISWVGFAYTFKWLWSPFVDRLPAPLLGKLGRRKGWAIFSQIVIAAALVAMATVGPHGPGGLVTIGAFALVVAFSSTVQDIAVDAWRIESAQDADELGLYTSTFQLGYRIASWITNAIILLFAAGFGWPISYGVMAALMGVGVVAALLTPEPARADAVLQQKSPLWTGRGALDAVLGPFVAFFREHGWLALAMLLMVSVYRMPEFVIGPIAVPFYHKLGFDNGTIGAVRGTIGLVTTLLGVAAGGVSAAALGFRRTLILGAVLQGIGVAGYALLAKLGGSVPLFGVVLGVDDFTGAFGSVAFIAYMSTLTSLGYTATQYALLSSAATFLGKSFKGLSGYAIDQLAHSHTLMDAYGLFYLGSGALAIPAVALCLAMAGRGKQGGAGARAQVRSGAAAE
jgi:PAT family beta-lactamase induction signal transducer AmpG